MASSSFNDAAETGAGSAYGPFGPRNDAEKRLLELVSNGDCSRGAIFGCMMKGANLSVRSNTPGEEGWTPLVYALRNRSEEGIEILLHFNVDIDMPTKGGDTALMWAIRNSRADSHKKEWEADTDFRLCRPLIREYEDGKGNIDCKNRAGETALIVAAREGKWDFVTRILEAGADPFAKDNEGKTALDHAKARPDTATYPGSAGLQMLEKLKKTHEDHIDAGMPTQAALAVKKPISFRK